MSYRNKAILFPLIVSWLDLSRDLRQVPTFSSLRNGGCMHRKPGIAAVLLLIGLLLFQCLAPDLQAQTAPPTPQQLDQLLAPVALYPDLLLAQITTASTN